MRRSPARRLFLSRSRRVVCPLRLARFYKSIPFAVSAIPLVRDGPSVTLPGRRRSMFSYYAPFTVHRPAMSPAFKSVVSTSILMGKS